MANEAKKIRGSGMNNETLNTDEEICTAYILDIDADPEAARAMILAAAVSNSLVFILLYLVT